MTTHVISEFTEVQTIFRNKDLHQALYDADPDFMRRSVVCLHGEEHLRKKKTVSSVFTRKFFRDYQNQVYPANIAEALAPALKAGRTDLVQFCYRVFVNLVSDVAGIDRARTVEETIRIQALIAKLSHAPVMGQLIGGDRDALLAEIRDALAEFSTRYYRPSVANRRALVARFQAGDLPREDLPEDVITAMLLEYGPEDMSEDERLRDAAFFILAGAFTTANALLNTLHEVMQWTQANPDDREKALGDPIAFQKLIWESLRLHPASPTAKRRVLKDFTLPDGTEAKEGDYIVLDLAKANRDKKIFGADANEFRPNRDLPKGVFLYGQSFGGGAHSCLGRMLAAGVPLTPQILGDEETEFGTLFMVTLELLRHGVRPDPDKPFTIDESTERKHFASYEVLLEQATVT